MNRTAAGTLTAQDIGRRVLLKGWVRKRRDHGGVIFLDVRDRSGFAQVIVHPDEQPAAAEALSPVRVEWVVEVEGEVARRADGQENPNMATGEVEILADRAVILSRAAELPFDVEGQAEVGEETRLRYRYLDIRRGELIANLALRHKVTVEILRFFDEEGFIHVETPILTRSTPEGARDYLVPSRVHRGDFFALPQSPQLFKQILMVAGLERYVQVARCFRDEDLRADRQPEFTQVDVEMSFPTQDEIFDLIERLFARIFPLGGIEPPIPFPRLTWRDAMARFGSDRPDLRYGLEIVDLSERLGKSGFRGFRTAVEEGGVVRGLAAPGLAGASRKQLDGWAELARRHGAAGVLALRRRESGPEFQVKGALSDEDVAWAVERLGLEEGGIALLAAGPEKTTALALGALRGALARECDLIPQGSHAFCWINEFPLVEWDEGEERWFACNHPFTSPDPRDLDRLDTDPGSVRSLGYDVVLDGYELGGGSIRIHEPQLQQRAFELLGIDAVEARERFGFLLDALSYGAPPHGGLALGLDRIVMLMAGASSLREVIAFPKTTSAFCQMTEAPSGVGTRQLDELGLSLGRESGE